MADSKLADNGTRRHIWAIAGAFSGNLIEWFDFHVYSLYSLYLVRTFFPSENTMTQLLQTAGIFAAGFLICPIDGRLFGRIANRHNCKESMLLSVCVICFGSLVIICLSGYEIIGTQAPALLLLAHLFQELLVGGEYGASATYMSGVAVEGYKGLYTSFQYMTSIGGQLLTLLVVVVLQYTMEDAILRERGWRIPFVLGAVLVVVALRLCRQLDEVSQQETRTLKEAGSLKRLRRNRRAFTMVLGFTAAASLCSYTLTIYVQKHLVNTVGIHANVASGTMTIAPFISMLIQPLISTLSDKIGRRISVLCFGSLVTILAVPALSASQNVSSPYAAFGLVMCALLIVSFYTSVSRILKAEVFPAQVHALGVGLSYAVADAIFDGPAEYVALSLKLVGIETAFFWYATLMAVVAFLASLTLHRRGKGRGLNDEPVVRRYSRCLHW